MSGAGLGGAASGVVIVCDRREKEGSSERGNEEKGKEEEIEGEEGRRESEVK